MNKKERMNELDVIRRLGKKHDVKVDSNLGNVYVLSNISDNKLHDLGNSSWGKIDFLINHCGYSLFYTL